MSNKQVALNWAQQKTNSRRGCVEWTTGNLYCEGLDLYSYGSHYLAARLIPENKVVVINCDYYSPSTQLHTSLAAEYAREAGYTVVYARLVRDYSSRDIDHILNFNSYRSSFSLLMGKLSKARKPELYTVQLAGMYREIVGALPHVGGLGKYPNELEFIGKLARYTE